jgi:hypothetical protein
MKQFTAVVLVLLLLDGSEGAARAQSPESTQALIVEFPDKDPVDLGWGWDERVGRSVRQSCIEFRTAEQKYADKRLSLRVANDHEALAKSLKVSVSGQVKTMVGARFSGSAEFAHSSVIESTSTNVALLAEVWTGPKYVAPLSGPAPDPKALVTAPDYSVADMRNFYQGVSVRLRPDKAALANDNLAKFVQECGTSFVAVIHQGARIQGILSFQETTEKDRKDISASASASGGGYSFHAALSTKTEEFSKKGRLGISFEQLGGQSKTLPMSKEALLDAVRDLPAEAIANPRPFSMIVQRYETLPGWNFQAVPKEPSNQEVVAEAYYRLRSLLAFAEEAMHKPGYLLIFDTTKSDLARLYDEMLVVRTELVALAQACQEGKACDAKKWRDWSDMPYRARMPMKGQLKDLPYGGTIQGLEKIPDLVAAARLEYWILDTNRSRCQYESECMTQKSIEQYRQDIRKRVALTSGL